MKRFQDKVVLVTGGSRNTGLAIVEKFAEEGALVYMCGSSPESTAAGAAYLQARGCRPAAAGMSGASPATFPTSRR